MVRIVASAELSVSPERAAKIILDPKMMEKWLSGARGLKADTTWPFFNTNVSWETDRGRGVCSARVKDNHLPEFVKVDVATPSHSREVTHHFRPLPNGGTLYERVVVAELYGLRKLFGTRTLRNQIEAEVKRAAALIVPEASSAPSKKKSAPKKAA